MIESPPERGPWQTSTVGAHFDIQLGKMLDAARNVGDSKLYLGNRAVQWGRIDIAAAGVVPLTREDQTRYRLKTNDLLVCEGGEVGRAAIWRDELDECYYQKALHRLRAKAGFDPRVMMALLEYWAETGAFDNFVTQTSIAHLPREKFLTMPLPIIPPYEQDSIAKVIDDANSLVGTLERVIVKKEAIKQGIMQALLAGRTRLPGFTGRWSTQKLTQLGAFLKGHGIKRDDVRVSGVACIRYGELYTTYLGYTSTTVSFVTPCIAASALPIRQGDLLFAGSGETREEIGTCVAYMGTQQAVAGGDVIVLRAPGVNPVYLSLLANTPSIAAQKARLGQGDAVVHINSRALGSIEVDLPPRDEQNAIANVLVEANKEVRELEARLTKAKAIKQGMMQELLTGRTRLPVLEAVSA